MKKSTYLLSLMLPLALWTQYASAELVLVTNPQNPAKNLNNAQFAQCYLGASIEFTPIEQAAGSPIRVEFYKKVLEKEPTQVQATWARLVFTGKGKPPKEVKTSDEVKKAIRENVNAIGYIEKAAVDDTVKVIAMIP